MGPKKNFSLFFLNILYNIYIDYFQVLQIIRYTKLNFRFETIYLKIFSPLFFLFTFYLFIPDSVFPSFISNNAVRADAETQTKLNLYCVRRLWLFYVDVVVHFSPSSSLNRNTVERPAISYYFNQIEMESRYVFFC